MNRLLPVPLLCAACNTPTAPSPPTAPCAGGDLRVQVQRLGNAQANDVARLLDETLANRSTSVGGCKVVVQPEHNALILSGTTEQIQETLKVVAQLDSGPGH